MQCACRAHLFSILTLQHRALFELSTPKNSLLGLLEGYHQRRDEASLQAAAMFGVSRRCQQLNAVLFEKILELKKDPDVPADAARIVDTDILRQTELD